tara:strand:- start:1165 stop:1509 length:345 start_codon:yes stop_codon:yes gene_type:complete
MSKPKVIKAYDAIDNVLKKQLRQEYPYGFDKRLISFTNVKGKIITALPYETEDRQYLIKMTSAMAAAIHSTDLETSSIVDEEEIEAVVMDLVGEDEELELTKEEKAEAKEAVEA